MKKKIIWLVASCSIVVALLLTSCGPAVTEEKEAAPAGEEETLPADSPPMQILRAGGLASFMRQEIERGDA